MHIGKSIEIALIMKGKKKKDLARALKVQRPYISVLVGKPNCSDTMLPKLLKFFDMTEEQFKNLG